MTRSKRRSAALAGALLVAAVGLAFPPLLLADSDNGWRLRFYAASIDFDSQESRSYDVDVGFGLGVNAEYRFSPRLGGRNRRESGAGAPSLALPSIFFWEKFAQNFVKLV